MFKLRNGWIISVLAASALLCQSAFACPCSVITVPERDPDYNNIDGIKFSETPQYKAEFEGAVESARKYCELHKNDYHRAIVSDLDETVFDNREFDAKNPKFVRSKWLEWVKTESVPCYPKTVEFLKWARRNGFAVFLVTTRGEDTRLATISNLIKAGIAYDGLFMRPTGNTETHQPLKTAYRRQIQDMGFQIVVNIGDQYSDLAGGFAQDCEKLPNRMYFHR